MNKNKPAARGHDGKKTNVKISLYTTLLITTTAALIGFGIYNYHSEKTRMYADLEKITDIAVDRLSENLQIALWNMNDDQVEENILSEMVEKSIYAILVKQKDGKAILKGKIRTESGEITDAGDDPLDAAIAKKKKVVKNEKDLGFVEVFSTDRFIRLQLARLFINKLIEIIFIDICVLLSLFLVIRRVMMNPVNDMVGELSHTFSELDLIVHHSLTFGRRLAERASQQAASIEEISASLEEISSMTRKNADVAGCARPLAEKISDALGEANRSMSQLKDFIQDISSASKETRKIVKAIDTIAFQTNLLALNAAVEAARVGDAGAGFAVVAGEVRNLALRVTEAARNTAELIEATDRKIENGSEMMRRSHAAFTGLFEGVTQLNEMVVQVANASVDQSQGIEQINKAVVGMDEMTRDTAIIADQSSDAAREVDVQAKQIHQVVRWLANLMGIVNDTEAAPLSRNPTHSRDTSPIPATDGGSREVITQALPKMPQP